MLRSYTIGHIAGTAVRVHWSFLALLLTLACAVLIVAGVGAALRIVLLILVLFACVVLHEFGHIAVARSFGIRTPEVVLLPIGGMAKMERMPEEPHKELTIAAAGPAVNFALFAIMVFALGRWPEARTITEISEPDANLLEQLALFNLVVGLFNLIPAFPMDGGRILRASIALFASRYTATRVAARIGQALAIVFALVGLSRAA